MMHGRGKSDSAILAAKPVNKADPPAAEQSVVETAAAELAEQRVGTKGNANQQSTHRAQSRASVSQALERIRKVARERKKERFTALLHHISIDMLGEAFFELKKDAAPVMWEMSNGETAAFFGAFAVVAIALLLT